MAARTTGSSPRYAKMLHRLGVPTYLGLGSDTLNLIEHGKFDIAIASFWYLAEELLTPLRRLSPQTKLLVESHDIHFLRNAREGLAGDEERSVPSALDDRFAAETMRELNVYAAADAVLTVSQKEADLINDLVGDPTLAHVVPDSEDFPVSPIPFEKRNGFLFVGNFRHPPNATALRHLCERILPLVSPEVLRDHPVTIVGNALDEGMAEYAARLPAVRPVGWVPAVVPYLHRARVCVVPLLSGAGTKRKLVQALMAGTPTVSTSVGVEGLNLENGRDVLVADDPEDFARCMERLATDHVSWRSLADSSRTVLDMRHGRMAASARLNEVLDLVLARPAKSEPVPSARLARSNNPYRAEVLDIRATVKRELPSGAQILVVSKGDEELVKFDGRPAWHFPRGEDGGFAGFYPADSHAAISHLEWLRKQGADYIVFPRTARWWLRYYAGLRRHLDSTYRIVYQSEACSIYGLAANDLIVGDPARASTNVRPAGAAR